MSHQGSRPGSRPCARLPQCVNLTATDTRMYAQGLVVAPRFATWFATLCSPSSVRQLNSDRYTYVCAGFSCRTKVCALVCDLVLAFFSASTYPCDMFKRVNLPLRHVERHVAQHVARVSWLAFLSASTYPCKRHVGYPELAHCARGQYLLN